LEDLDVKIRHQLDDTISLAGKLLDRGFERSRGWSEYIMKDSETLATLDERSRPWDCYIYTVYA
jgi:hypothetical protein